MASSQPPTQPLSHVSMQPYTQVSSQTPTRASTGRPPYVPDRFLTNVTPHEPFQSYSQILSLWSPRTPTQLQTQRLSTNYQLPSGPESITYQIYCTAGSLQVPHDLYRITTSDQLWAICAHELRSVQLSTTTTTAPININSVFYWNPNTQGWRGVYYSISWGSIQEMKEDLANVDLGAGEVIRVFVLVQGEAQDTLPTSRTQREWDLGDVPATFNAGAAIYDLNANQGS
ncbi:hypothetical protein IFR05_002004 [Cadophora sp. M221]|nr:hypothetical protein IFR05_002004 [Cadophora sp. M221]